MKATKQETYTFEFDLAEMAVLGAGYILCYPASNMAWFHRQVIGNTVRYQELLNWLTAAHEDPDRERVSGVTIQALLEDLEPLGLGGISKDSQVKIEYVPTAVTTEK